VEENIKTWFDGTLTNSVSIQDSPAPYPYLDDGHKIKKVTEKEVRLFFQK
jgi:hypothetical protein